MLQVDLRELARGPVQTRAELAGDDPLFEGLEVVLADPVRVAGRLQSAGEGRFYWRGSLSTQVAGVCRRCLRSEEHTSELQSHSDLVCRLLLEKKNKR